MNLKQGQEVRDAADPSRIGIVVGTGSSLGARVLWCWDESLTWTSERPVIAPRLPADVLTDPRPGDKFVWPDGGELIADVVGDDYVAFRRVEIGRMTRKAWADWSEDVDPGMPVPVQA